jgi:hypothetical protein
MGLRHLGHFGGGVFLGIGRSRGLGGSITELSVTG